MQSRLPAPLRRDLARFATTPFEAATMLPLEVYRSPAVLCAEHERVLMPAWHCVGRTADVPHPGDHLTAEIPHLHDDGSTGSRGVLVARGDDGELRAFDNRCVHRGAPLAAGCGSVARFTCPYHAWAFRLDGRLIGAPYMQGPDGRPFDADAHRLGELRLEQWEGFVFVTADSNAEPLSHRLSGLCDVVAPFAMATYVPVHRQVDEWDTNWKLLVENFVDTYHVFRVHRATFGATSDSPTNTTMYPGTDAWAYHVALDRNDTAHPANTSLTGDWRRAVVLAALFPTLVMQLQPDFLWHLQISPLGTHRVRIRWDVAVAPDVLADQADPSAYVAGLLDLLHAVNAEDRPIVESVRRSAEGPQFARAPLSIYEQNVHDFDLHVARRLAT